MAADDKCSMEVAKAGGVHALVMLARNCKCEGVQEQVGLLSIIDLNRYMDSPGRIGLFQLSVA